MLPVYLVVGLLNIFSQHHNYGIKIDDPNFDIRVRRSIPEDAKQQVFNLRNNEDYNLKREKRNAYYKKTRITDNDLIRYNNENNNNEINSTRNITNRYDIFNPNWNYLFNTTNNNRNNNVNNSGVNNPTINNRQIIISSYPYGYPPGSAPNLRPGTGRTASTTGYRNQNNNAPHFYNYQDPDRQNFAGFMGYAADQSGQVNTPIPYAPRGNNTDASNTPWNHALAPYPPSYTQRPVPNPPNNDMPSSYAPTDNSGIHKLPYATNPGNRVYNNNFNSIPKPFDKDNLASYAPNFNSGSPNLNNGSGNFNSGSLNFNTGTAYYNNGSHNSHTGSSNINTETVYFNNGSSNSNTGSPIVNNATADFSTVSPNFNTGSPNVNNGSYAPANNTDTTVTTTEKILKICIICNIPCPKFMRRFGQFCMDPDAVDDDY